MHEVDAEHRQHAQVELVIRDLDDQAFAHFPSGDCRPAPTVGLNGRAHVVPGK